MSETRSVAIIMPVYNTADFLDETLQSVWDQTEETFTLVAVDDGSSDGSGKILDRWADKNWAGGRQMIVIHQENAGAAAARNRAVEASSEPLLVFLDSDDTMDPDLLRRLAAELEGDAGAVMAFPLVRYVGEDGQFLGVSSTYAHGTAGAAELLAHNPIHSGTGVAVRRAALEKAGPFDQEMKSCIDLDMWVRTLMTSGGHARCLGVPMVGYRKREGQITGNWKRMRAGRERVFDKVEAHDQALAAKVRDEATARASVFWATIAYGNGEYADARRLLRDAWRRAPGKLARDREALFRTATALVSLLPTPLHHFIRDRYNA